MLNKLTRKTLTKKIIKYKGNLNLKRGDWKFILIIGAFFLLSLLNMLISPKKVSVDRVLGTTDNLNLEEKTAFWTGFLNKHPDYVDGWLELAKLEYAKGNFQRSKKAILNAYEISPNSEKIKKLEVMLGI